MTFSEKQFREIIDPLPRKEQSKLNRKDLDVTVLEDWIVNAEDAMKRDLWVGIPWFVMYTSSLLIFGFQNSTTALLVIGVIYFTYSYVKFGSYGLNRVRVKVFRELVEGLKKR